MSGLLAHLRRRIALEGPLTVADYMAEALGHPRYGYYRTRDPLGAAGDFVTAPEVSQMFGELIGLWLAVAWRDVGAPAPVVLAELGPGRGTLMADALRAGRAVAGFTEAVHLHLVETSPALRAVQARTLADAPLAQPPAWHDGADSLPDGPMLLVANEFFDALPIRQFQRDGDGWRERLVTADGDCLAFGMGSARPPPAYLPESLTSAPDGAVAEVCPAAIGLMAALAARIAADGIAALVIDYGHTQSGSGDTLQAVRGHRYADPLAEPGEADLTAHVDFAALARTAIESGAGVHGPVTQGEFLTAMGIEARAGVLAGADGGRHAAAIAAARDRLTGPAAMGALFKAMAVTAPGITVPGFS